MIRITNHLLFLTEEKQGGILIRLEQVVMAEHIDTAQNDKRSLKSVAVVGAGLSGLAAAYRLKSQGLAVTVFEADGTAGGKIKSVAQNGLIWEKGANTMTETEPEVRKLIDDLGIRGQQQFPIMQSKRYIVRDGKSQLLPSNPVAFIGSKILSAQAKLNIFMEPILWKYKNSKEKTPNSPDIHQEESVGDFFRRHFGQEVVDYIVDPFVAGISAADVESLSIRHVFPEIWDLEERFGSIIVGAIKSSWSRKKAQRDAKHITQGPKHQRGSFSFMGGMQTLTNALSTKLGEESLRMHCSVLSLSCNLQGNPPHNNWSVCYARNDASYKEPLKEQTFDAVVMTAPLCKFQEMQVIKHDRPFSLDFLPKVTYLPLSIIITAFKKQDVKRPLEGFGILVPSKEEKNGFRTLGTLFSSSMFPDRAPTDQYLFTTFIGGNRNRKLAKSQLKDLQEVAVNDLNKVLGVGSDPLSVKHIYWNEAFPLYSLDYNSVLAAIDKMGKSLPGLYFAGNYKGGLSVGKALVSGFKAADLAISGLNSRGLCTMMGTDHEVK